ncbi:hypothetical protein GUITHDRAFT_77409, partial [Guillardia theta CCMP2712]
GRHHGRGVCVWKSRGLIYDGEWHRGSRQGQAMVKYPDGSLYEGGYKQDMLMLFQGHGRFEYSNGSWYQGGWVADKRHGYGYLFWSTTGEAHQGMFENDLPHGKGARYYPSGEVYMGGWQNGEKHGVGVLEGPQEESDEQEKQTKDQEGAPASVGMKKIKSHACIDGLPLDVVDLRSSVRSLSFMFSSLILTVLVRMAKNPRKERTTIWSMQNGRMRMIKRTSMLSDGNL